MKLLTPDRAIYALESQVITPNHTLNPTLGVVIKGDAEEDSMSYLRSIQKKAEQYKASVEIHKANTASGAAMSINQLKQNPGVYGIINLSHFGGADRGLNNMIPSRLDIDCASSYTLGHLFANKSNIGYRMAPCAAVAALKLLEYDGLSDLTGYNVAVLGRSLRVGRPLSEILLQKNATVTTFHSKSYIVGLDQYDIVISAIGKPEFINYYKHFWSGDEYQCRTKYLIDIGINQNESEKICGDFDITSFGDIDCKYTPVPGGVGKLATVILFAKLFTNATGVNAPSSGEYN